MTLLQEIIDLVDDLAGDRAVVAIDGPDAAGKTRLADRVAEGATAPVIRASIDDFHYPRAVRHRRGSLSPEGYFRDTFDYTALRGQLLDPFVRGDAMVCTGCFDLARDVETMRYAEVPEQAVLVVDGVFLLRPELRHWWSLSVYLHVTEEVTLARALERDLEYLGDVDTIEARYAARYLPGQALYRAECHPADTAHVVLDNTDPLAPIPLKWSPDGRGSSPRA